MKLIESHRKPLCFPKIKKQKDKKIDKLKEESETVIEIDTRTNQLCITISDVNFCKDHRDKTEVPERINQL